MTHGTLQRRTILPIFAFSLFLSAALMFAVQPLAGKMLLPLVGGTPSGWVVAMAFFQICLLLGYFLAHFLSRFPPRLHAVLFLACLGIGFLFLPVELKNHRNLLGETPGPIGVFLLLGVTVAVPFIALSMTAPTLQRLFSATAHPGARDPYFLYAASNLGSFIGLFAYPLLIEPVLTLTEQSLVWRDGFALLALISAFAFLMTAKSAGMTPTAASGQEPLPWPRRLRWLALSFVPSSLMMGVTTFITIDIISAPMIWAVPLGIYLLTFVLAFARNSPLSARKLADIHPMAIVLSLGLGVFVSLFGTGLAAVLLHLAAFTTVALMCHKMLADDRPSPGRLTEFYLWLSLGGALGGAVNAFFLPFILPFAFDFQIVLLLSSFLNPGFYQPAHRKTMLLCLIGSIGIAAYSLLASTLGKDGFLMGVLILASFMLLSVHPRTSLIAGLFSLVFTVSNTLMGDTLNIHRNFFGVARVFEYTVSVGEARQAVRFLRHGTTTHGFQLRGDELMQKMLVSYYSRGGPLGDIFTAFSPQSVSVIGLGTGSISCYTAPGRHYTFFEIDPSIIDIAKKDFTFLKLCAPDAAIVTGDARLSLEREPGTRYDMILLDAFSSDTIPAHLLTIEAIKTYLEHLNEGGVIVLHLSNRFFALEKIVSAAANELGLQNRFKADIKPTIPFAYSSEWMVVTRDNINLSGLLQDMNWTSISPPAVTRPWTDDYTSLLTALK